MFFTDDTYTSSLILQIEKLPDDDKKTSTTELSFARNALPTIKYCLATEDFLDQIIDVLPAVESEDAVSYKALKSMVALSVIEDTELLRIDVTSSDEVFAFSVAKAYSEIVPGFVMEMYKQNIEVELRNSPRAATVNSRGTVKNAIVGFIGGALLAAVMVFVVSMLDVTVHDRKKIEENFDLPVLGVIPKVDVTGASKGGKR